VLARVVLALLVVASAAALWIAQQLKHKDPLINASGVVWHPTGAFDPYATPARFSFQAYYKDHITVSIIATKTGRVVDVIARDYAVRIGHRTPTWSWPGITTTGAIVPSGTYSVQVHFERMDRTTALPEAVFYVRDPP
jgi:hypothetical protein